jgi:CRP/FNR family cyclic AMP-dependent transcriptional regulator
MNISSRPSNRAGILDAWHVVNTSVRYQPLQTIFAQGDAGATVLYIQKGRVQLRVTSPAGREAVVGVLTAGSFLGEGALAGQRRRRVTAVAMSGSIISTVKLAEMRRRLHEESALSDWFRSHLLTRNTQIEAALVEQLFNRCEQRLARALLLLTHFDEHHATRYALPTISRRVLAETIGTSRANVDVLMNRFRKLGFLERHRERDGGLYVHRSMLSVVLQD